MILKCEELIKISDDLKVTINGKIITIEGPKGTVTKDLSHLPVYIDINDSNIRCRLWNAKKIDRSKVITCSKLIKNMIKGVTKKYVYKLKCAYKHFSISCEVSKDGKYLMIKNFLGEKTSRYFKALGDSIIRMGETKDVIYIEGTDLDDVSQLAGRIQNECRPKNLDNRIFQDGIYIAAKGVLGEI